MTWLAVLLLGLGVADLVQAIGARRPRWVATAAGAAAQTLAGLLALPRTPADGIALAACLLALLGWRAAHRQPQRSRSAALWGLAAGAAPVTVAVACSGLAPAASGPLAAWLGSIPLLGLSAAGPDRAFLLLAAAAANLETANLLVRDTLVATGTSPVVRGYADDDGPPLLGPRRLRGGRALGAMERLLILGFGASGNLAAAGLVVAAKGLVRFPELTAASRGNPPRPRIDEVTEYFLIGSFASILLALASVALTA